METKFGSERKVTVAIYEALGTLLFTYCILVSNADAIAGAFALFTMIVIFGSVSGGHFNPAVTVGVYLAQGDHYMDNLPLGGFVIVAQCIGSLAGALLSSFTLSKDGIVDA